METKNVVDMWWLKSNRPGKLLEDLENKNLQAEEEISNSLAEFMEKERDLNEEVDIGSILEEISRLSAKSPLGPYDDNIGNRSVEDIMREAEKIYLESSKSFEQLSQHSKTSHNITEITSSKSSTPTPKSISPLPLDTPKQALDVNNSIYEDSYSSSSSEIHSPAFKTPTLGAEEVEQKYSFDFESASSKDSEETAKGLVKEVSVEVHQEEKVDDEVIETFKEEIVKKDEVIKMLILDNRGLKDEIENLRTQMQETQQQIQQVQIKSPDAELQHALEQLKDTKEINTSLQVQLDTTNKSHIELKNNYEELLANSKDLERKVLEVDKVLERYKIELVAVQQAKEKLLESESNVLRQLEAEKVQVRTLKLKSEKDSKCILDLNRQIKEMERIIARKHPDSVSALIVAAKRDPTDSRKVLEDRIKSLEQEALIRDAQNSQVFIDVQEKFNQMKLKYESHIEDLELHVNDLKNQLKRKTDTYDVYTQTYREDQKIPEKEKNNIGIQTEILQSVKKVGTKKIEKEETHLLATIRGFQADLANKEKVIVKLQKEIDELRKTNRRLQKEREGSLKNLSEKREFRSYPEKLASQALETKLVTSESFEDEIKVLRTERDKMKKQLCRIEEDYQNLKSKRLQDLNTLQEAHEREISTYLANITPLREQLEVQEVALSTLKQQLIAAKEELAVVSVERDHLNNKLECGFNIQTRLCDNGNDEPEVTILRKKIAHLEMRYEERENRLRAIVHGLAQKSVMNRSCEQCAARQQQLIGYKAELDQLIATLRCLQ